MANTATCTLHIVTDVAQTVVSTTLADAESIVKKILYDPEEFSKVVTPEGIYYIRTDKIVEIFIQK